MAHRDKDRLDPLSGADHGPDHLVPMAQERPAPLLSGRCGVVAAKTGLGAARGGTIEKDPQMGGQSHAARMGESVGVEDQDVGGLRQLLQCVKDHRTLAKGEKSRHVGEGGWSPRGDCLDGAEVRPRQQHDGGAGVPVPHAHVDAADDLELGLQGRHDDAGAKVVLYLDGARARDVPRMVHDRLEAHGASTRGSEMGSRVMFVISSALTSLVVVGCTDGSAPDADLRCPGGRDGAACAVVG